MIKIFRDLFLSMLKKFEKLKFMSKKLLKDVQRDKDIYQTTDDLYSPVLGPYYFLIDEQQLLAGHSQDYHFDGQGIPIIPSYIDVEQQRMVYYPISIGQYGLAIFHTFLKTRRDEDRKRFLNIVNWFYDNRAMDIERGALWLTNVPKPEYRIHGPWPSAFSQSRAISILLRGYQLTGDDKYKLAADNALAIFYVPADQGGVTTFTDYGPFYEEYPTAFPTMVLDGFFFTLCGLWDHVRAVGNDSPARFLFDKGVEALVKWLPHFDLGYWIRYNYCQEDFYPDVDPATIGYLRLVITQLKLFYRITGIEALNELAEKWRRYDRILNILKMYSAKYKALKKLNRL